MLQVVLARPVVLLMRLLFLAFALSFCALLWVAFSVTRHIRRHKAPGSGTEAAIEGTPLTAREAKADRQPARPRP